MNAEYTHPIFTQFRGLVEGVRPSIAWLAGLDTPGVDLLDMDGRSGWRIGCRRLQTELGKLESELTGADLAAANALQRWLPYEALVETSRWQTPLMLIDHFASVAMTVVEHEPMLRRDMFVVAWTRSFRTTLSTPTLQPWRMPNTLSGSIARIIGELASDRTATELTSLLFELVCSANGATSNDAEEQLIGPEFHPELTSALRHALGSPTGPFSNAWPRENV